MIARHESYTDRTDVWARLASPLPDGVVSWRQDGGVIARDGRYFARFVAYVDANTVRERLDGVVPGEWDLALELLPSLTGADDDDGYGCSFKARLQVLGVIREDVGTGRDYKSAATDAFKRAAVRFGVAHELYALEQNWVQMDGDGRGARPVEDPATAYERRYGGRTRASDTRGRGRALSMAGRPTVDSAVEGTLRNAGGEVERALTKVDAELPECPRCGGRMWDNRLSKRNPRAPDFKCRDRSCDGVIWPARDGDEATPTADRGHGSGQSDQTSVQAHAVTATQAGSEDAPAAGEPVPPVPTDGEIPF